MTSTEMLALAQELLDRADARTAGLWPRTAALLVRQALEQGLDDYWRAKGLPLQACGTKPQFLCLSEYLGDVQLSGHAHHAWAVLSEACHHHPYELSPSQGELTAWVQVVEEILPRLSVSARIMEG